MKRNPIGIDNFKNIVEEEYYFVDKTKAIEELLDLGVAVALFTRPRRFGKSLFISMLEHFFDIDKKATNQDLFKGLYIENSTYYNERNTYPVINLDFKNLKADTYDKFYEQYKFMMAEVYISKKSYLYETLTQEEQKYYDSITFQSGGESNFKLALSQLSKFLERYYNKKVIILIDEYDVPIQNGYIKKYYDKIIEFIKGVLSSSLKGNDSLKMGVLTGVLRVSKESIFSDLNNLKVYSVMDEAYNKYFGFTEKETQEFLKYYGLELNEEVKNMYDGYQFGNVSIYNPWSILNYASDKKLKLYWVNTSGNDLIKELLQNTTKENKEKLERLVLEEELAFTYDEKITYKNFDKRDSLNNIINILLASGYLTITKTEENVFYAKIPNKEVKELITSIMSETITGEETIHVYELKKAIEEENKEEMEKIINQMLKSVSYMDQKESFYHGYLLGIFKAYLTDEEYIVKSNRESGVGRYDVLLEKKDRTKGSIFEFKLAKNEEEMNRLAEVAQEQMKSKRYYEELELENVKNIICYAVVFYEKKCIVR